MIERAMLSRPRASSASLKLPLFFAFSTGFIFFFLLKAGLPPLTSPLALIACWFIEKTSLFTSLISISLLSAFLDPLYGTESKMWMISQTLASFISFLIPTRIINLPKQMRWALRLFFWSFIVINAQVLIYPENFNSNTLFHNSLFPSFFSHFFESLALSLYDSIILGVAACVCLSWVRED